MHKKCIIFVHIGAYKGEVPYKKVKKAFKGMGLSEIQAMLRTRCACEQSEPNKLEKVIAHFGELPDKIEGNLLKHITK